jgi:short-subunit dehydrogenase
VRLPGARVVVTGASRGIGAALATELAARGASVVLVARSVEPLEKLAAELGGESFAADLADASAIEPLVRRIEAEGPIDVLVNNAGVGLLNALEGVSMDKVREVFETNTLGSIAMTQAVLPQMRERRSGAVVNVSSSVTLRPLRLLSVYTASKAAVNAFTESLALELEPFGVRARLVLPGAAPETAFGANARARMGMNVPEAYAELAAEVFAGMQQRHEFTRALDVAEAVWRAATDPTCPMRLPAGADAVAWATAN